MNFFLTVVVKCTHDLEITLKCYGHGPAVVLFRPDHVLSQNVYAVSQDLFYE